MMLHRFQRFPFASPRFVRFGFTAMTSIALASAFLIGTLSTTAQAQAVGAGLMLSPTRIVMEGKERSTIVRVINGGTETGTYRVSLIHQRMTVDGNLVSVETPRPDVQVADDLVVYAPRVVKIPPGGQQTVRILVRKPADLPFGEYRSHLLVQAVPPADAGASLQGLLGEDDQGGDPGDASGPTIRLTPVFGIAIPLIVRHGATSASVSISEVKLHPAETAKEQPTLSAVFHRRGNQSTYGDVTVRFSPVDGPAQVVGTIKGIAIYTPNELRRFQMSLNVPPSVTLENGTLLVSYNRPEKAGGALIAEARIDL